MIALMIISIGAIMYSAGTYYRYEQWEEYITLVEHVKLSTIRLIQISLANYTAPGNNSTLKANLDQWQNDLKKAYPGYGVILTYDLANGSYQAYNTKINYTLGLARRWNENASFSAANATFTLNIASIGLTGYEFTTAPFLNLTLINIDNAAKEITVTVKAEDGTPITNLKEDNFQVSNLTITGVTPHYDPKELLKYIIKCDGIIQAPVTVRVWDQRGIKVIAKNT